MRARRERDARYAAFLALALVLVLVLFIHERGYVFVRRRGPAKMAEGVFPGFPVDINTAGEEALMLLPGVGRTTARRIIAEREKRGGFRNIYDLRHMRGMGRERFEALKTYIVVRKNRRN